MKTTFFLVFSFPLFLLAQSKIVIETFEVFPREIDGCSCYFSTDSVKFKKKEYIYVNNYATLSFMKINGVMTRFTRYEIKQIDGSTTQYKSKSAEYELTIEIKDGARSGDETWFKTGMIKLTDKNGKVITKKFYGECGC